MVDRHQIPARKGLAVRVEEGRTVRIVNTHGTQVVDTWAFVESDLSEFMSMEHSRAGMNRLTPKVGDMLLTNRRAPILKVVEDTSGGVHDTFIAACDIHRFRGLGCTEYHDNCQDNLWNAMRALGVAPPETPSPLNVFMNIPWDLEGRIDWKPPVSPPGSYLALEAQRDVVVAFSACPQDIIPINGEACVPVEAHVEVI